MSDRVRNLPDDPVYSMTQVSVMTGVPKQTLYAWERRYGLFRYAASGENRRLYSSREISRVRLLKACVDQGNRIGSLVGSDDGQLRRLLHRNTTQAVKLDKLMVLINELRTYELEVELGLHLLTMGTTLFVEELVAPLMKEVGVRWQEKALPVVAEHLVTASVRSLLVSALHISGRRRSTKRAVFATLEDEHHEIGLLAAAIIATNHDLEPVYLGTCVPLHELPSAVAKTAAHAVIIGSTIADVEDLASRLEHLKSHLPQEVPVLLGGENSRRLRHWSVPGIAAFPTLYDLESFLGQTPGSLGRR